MDWTNEQCLLLIDEYRNRPVLWDSTSMFFKNKIKKEDAWSEMAVNLKAEIPDIKKKMISLLASFRRERQKVLNKPSGSGLNDIYQTKWFAFKSFMFLIDKNKPKHSLDTDLDESTGSKRLGSEHDETDLQDDDTIMFDENIEASNKERSTAIENKIYQPHNSSKKRKCPSDDPMIMEAYNALKSVTQNKERDGSAIYGEYVADKLRSYDKRTRSVVQHYFSDILFKADMGNFDVNIQISTPPSPVFSRYIEHQNMPAYSTQRQDINIQSPTFTINSLSSTDECNRLYNQNEDTNFDPLE